MSNPVGIVARAAAQKLGDAAPPGLAADVEAALARGTYRPEPSQYSDPVELAGLIVSAATLAWTVYNDLRARTAAPALPAAETVIRAVQVRLREEGEDAAPGGVLEVVVTEVIRVAGDQRNH